MPLRITLERILDQLETLETRRREGVDLYEQEFQRLKSLSENLRTLPEYSCSCGEKDVNRRKNRYKDILPFDSTRVILSEIPGVPGSDYINANYIKGASGSLAYIASQGPLPHTVEDFWRMVWECEVQVIIMASSEVEGGKHKCERYWVYENEERTFGNLKITLTRMNQVCVDFIVRTMNLNCNNEDRTIIQFHYVSWPDHGIPDSVAPILNMVKLIRDCQASETLPILVHCSAGCGRTGTICAIDYVWGLLRTGKLTDDFNLYHLIVDMRKQRIAMVQTKEQYILVHRAVKEMFEHHLKVIDSHPYENIDFSGLPLIDKTDSDLSSNDLNLETSSSASLSADQQLQKFLSQLESSEVPPIPEKKKMAGVTKVSEQLPSPNDVSVKHLISTWNSGRPFPVNDFENDAKSETSIYSVENKSSESIHKQKLDHCDVGLHREDDQAKARYIEKASMESEHSLVSPDKAVVLRKPSIAKLRAIFEKTPPQEEASEQEKGHNSRDVQRSESDRKKTSGLKRHKSHFRKITDIPQVTARYKDTALKVYAEIKNSDDQESTESISSSSESKTSSSPVDKGKDSPEQDFLYRLGSRRRSTQRNPASVWYDKEAELNQAKIEESSMQKSPEKPVPAVKRSKSLKVHSITENAFGFFKLPSPLRHRKMAVAAYLGVEEERASVERSDTSNAVQVENVGSNAFSENNMKEAETKTEMSQFDKSNIDVNTSDVNKSENIPSTSNQVKDNSKEKVKIKHFFGEKASNAIPNSGNDSVKLVHVRSSLDAETDALHVDAEKVVIDTNDRHYPIEKSKSVERIKVESASEDSLTCSKNLKSGKEVRNGKKQHYHIYSNTVPNIEAVKKMSYDVTPSQHLKQTFSSKSADQIEDKPPPLPVKVNSPRNSPRFQRPVRSLENTLDKNKLPKQWEQKPIKKLAVISVPSVTNETKQDKDETDVPVQLTVSAPSTLSDSLGNSEKSSHLVDDEEGYQQIIRSCQEYLLSSSYTNIFPEMQKNILFIEQTLQKHPRGGFIDVLSSNESIASNPATDKNSNLDSVDNSLNQTHAGLESSPTDGSWKVIEDSQASIETNVSDKTDSFLPNAALDELLASCENYSSDKSRQPEDGFQCKIQLGDDNKISGLSPVNSVTENANDMNVLPVNSDSNKIQEINRDDKLTKVKENKSKTNYEHLWLSHSGNCSETSDIIPNKNQTDDECISIKMQEEKTTMESSLNEIVPPPEMIVNETVLMSPQSETELTHTYVNLQQLELQNLQDNSTDLEKHSVKDSSHVRSSSVPLNEGQTNKTSSPAVARRKKNMLDSKENDPAWNLNSYKILKEILHRQSSIDESQFKGVSMTIADPQVNKASVQTFDSSHSKSKISQEPPPKPARVHYDNKNRKPQPLPRNTLSAKKDIPAGFETNLSASNVDNRMSRSQEITNNSRNNCRDEELYAMVVHKDVDDIKNVSEKSDVKKENDYEEIILPPIVPQQERLLGPSRNNKRFKDALFSNESSVQRSSGEFHPSPLDLVYSKADSLLNNTRQYQRSFSCSSAADHVYESLEQITEPSSSSKEKEVLLFKTSPELFLGNLPRHPSSEEVVSEHSDGSRNSQCQQFDDVKTAATGLQSDGKEIDTSMYSEVSKCKTNQLVARSPSSDQDDTNVFSYTKDDMELYPVAPPRKRQSSSVATSEANSEQFWKTRTLLGRSSSCLQDDSSPVQQWGEEWDSDDDCQPPVPAKTKEAYMLPNQRDSTSPGSSQDGSEPKNKSFSKFNIFSKLGLKTDNKNSDGVNATAFPNRLPRKPRGPRTPPASWNVGVPTRT